MENFLIIAVVVLVIGCAAAYIVKAKKKGVKCVGCPYAESCGKGKNDCSCNCKTDR